MFNRMVGVGLVLAGLLPLGAKDNNSEGFSGRWILDTKTSTAPEGMGQLEQRVKQSGSQVTIESKFSEPANGIVPLLYLGVMTTKVTLNTGGSEVQNQIGPFQQVSKTTLSANQMQTEWQAEIKGDRVEGHWIRTLSDDGRRMTLTIKESSTKGQQGEAELHFVRK